MSMQSAPHRSAHSTGSGIQLVEDDLVQTQLVGRNAAWRKLLVQAEMVAPHAQVAAMEGEPGTGKRTLAHYLHSRTSVVRSAFMRRDAREWLVTEADPTALSGFLYLDRVDLLAAPGQGLLLGVLKALQDRAPGRLVLVASSHASLRQMASQGLMLPDLAFRLTAVRFALPPLRERREDIAPLAHALLERICARYQLRPAVLGPGTLPRLLQHPWPGNIRELASVLEAALLEVAGNVIRAEDLLLSVPAPSQATPQATPSPEPVDLSLSSVIRHHVQHVLDRNHGNKLRTARQLGISRSTLYRILSSSSVLA